MWMGSHNVSPEAVAYLTLTQCSLPCSLSCYPYICVSLIFTFWASSSRGPGGRFIQLARLVGLTLYQSPTSGGSSCFTRPLKWLTGISFFRSDCVPVTTQTCSSLASRLSLLSLFRTLTWTCQRTDWCCGLVRGQTGVVDLSENRLVLWTCQRTDWCCGLVREQTGAVDLSEDRLVLWTCQRTDWCCGLVRGQTGAVDCNSR